MKKAKVYITPITKFDLKKLAKLTKLSYSCVLKHFLGERNNPKTWEKLTKVIRKYVPDFDKEEFLAAEQKVYEDRLLEDFEQALEEKGMNKKGFCKVFGIDYRNFLNTLSAFKKILPVMKDFLKEHKG